MSVKLNNELLSKFKECIGIVNESKRITITTHVNPDGDAIGSTLAFYYYVLSKGAEARIIIHSPVPYNYEFLPGTSEIRRYSGEEEDYILSSDAIFLIDINDVNRTKSVSEAINKAKCKKVVIDHHIKPKEFADLYIDEEEATSAGELIYELLKFDDEFVIDKRIAECLYAAIMTDTGSFRFERTDARTHRIIAELIDYGANPTDLYDSIYNKRPFRVMKLYGEALVNMELHYDGKLCVMLVTKGSYKRAGAVEEDVEDIVENSLTIEGVKVGVLLSENRSKEEIRISFRGKYDIPARNLALEFGGGGHMQAAGARVHGEPLEKVKNDVIKKAAKLFE